MRSKQAASIDPKNEPLYTDLKVMKSAAGFYIGTEYKDPECGGLMVPGSRDSKYFLTRVEAEKWLKDLEEGRVTSRMDP